MTATLSRDTAIERPADTTRRRTRKTPPGSEAMAPPWRLAIVGIGTAIGLVARLLAANGYFSVLATTMVLAAAATSLVTGVGLLLVAAERDRFDRWMILLSAMVGLAFGALQWISPHFSRDTLEWDNGSQLALGLLGVGNGLLLAGIFTLAFVRRWPTLSVVATLATGLLTLMADTVLLRNEWPAIAAVALSIACLLLAWDQAPRHERRYDAFEGSPRISRAALILLTVAAAGAVIQLRISRNTSVDRGLGAVVLAVILVLVAFMALIRIRREIQQRRTTLSEWTSWMREIRTGDFRGDFETLATSESGVVVGDVTAETPRVLTFPDLRSDAPAPAAAVQPAGDSTAPVTPAASFGALTAPPPSAFELLWGKGADERADDPLWPPMPDENQPALFDAEQLPPAAPAPAPASAAPDAPAIPPKPAQPAPVEQQLPIVVPIKPPAATATPPVQPAPQPAPAPQSTPAPAAQPAATPKPAAAPRQPSRPQRTEPITSEAPALVVAATSNPSGAFSSWLDTKQPSAMGTLDDLGQWLDRTAAPGVERIIVAVEAMSLEDYDMLPPEVSRAAIDALADAIQALTPRPTLVAPIDGPYLMAAWDHLAAPRLVNLNRSVLGVLANPVDTPHGAVALTGTLAMLRPAPDNGLVALIDDAITGLVHARRLGASAR